MMNLRTNLNLTAKVLVLLCTYLMAYTQSDLPTDEVEVIKNFEVTLQKTARLKIDAPQVQIQSQAEIFKYDVNLKPLKLEYPAPYIRPIAYNKIRTTPIKKGYAKLGYGSLLNPLFYGNYEIGIQNYYTLGTKVSFESIQQKNVVNKKYRDIDAEIYAKYFITKDLITDASFFGQHETDHFFGFNDMNINEPISEESRTNSSYGVKFNMSKQFGDKNDFVISANSRYELNSLSDLDLTEHRVSISPQILKYLSRHISLSALAKADWSFYSLSENKSNHNYQVQPTLKLNILKSFLDLGIIYIADQQGNFLLPNALFRISTIAKNVSLSFGVESEYIKNNFRTLGNTNPYFIDFRNEINNTYKSNYFVQSDFKIWKLSLDLESGYNALNNFNFFLNAPNEPTRFNLIQDDLNIKYAKLSISYVPITNLNLNLKTVFNQYNGFKDLEHPWHLPKLDISLGSKYQLFTNRLNIGMQLHYLGGAKTQNLVGDPIDLNHQIDLSLQASYWITDYISVEAEGLNLINSDYQQWYGYSIFGRNIKAGVKVVF